MWHIPSVADLNGIIKLMGAAVQVNRLRICEWNLYWWKMHWLWRASGLYRRQNAEQNSITLLSHLEKVLLRADWFWIQDCTNASMDVVVRRCSAFAFRSTECWDLLRGMAWRRWKKQMKNDVCTRNVYSKKANDFNRIRGLLQVE